MNERPEIPENITHGDYFNQLLKARVNLSPMTKIFSLNAIIQFDITDCGKGIWNVVIENGLVKEVTTAFCKKPTCVFMMDSATFLSIIRREITPQKAFFRGRVDIKGDMFLALKMNILVNYM